MLEIKNLKKSYRNLVAVKDLTLTIADGEWLGLIGPNGAGKSTTLKSLTGQIVPDSGEIMINGTDMRADPIAAKRLLGYVPQELNLYPYLTGWEFLQFIADIKGCENVDAEMQELMEALAIWDARNRLTREYSEGMARKLAICAAIIGHPPVIIFDESLNGLDPQSSYEVKQRLSKIKTERNASIILASHILDTVEKVCDRVALLARGELIALFTKEELDERRHQRGQTLEDLYLELT